jgi:hypothetical protein
MTSISARSGVTAAAAFLTWAKLAHGPDNDMTCLLDHMSEVEGDQGFVFGNQNFERHWEGT